MRQSVILAEQSPYPFLVFILAALKLNSFHLGKFTNKFLVNYQTLPAVLARRLIFMLTYSSFRNSVIIKYGLPSSAGMPSMLAAICA